MARLRVFRKNGSKVYDLIRDKESREQKERRIEKLDYRVLKKELCTSNQTLDNITALNIGRRTRATEMLKLFRGA